MMTRRIMKTFKKLSKGRYLIKTIPFTYLKISKKKGSMRKSRSSCWSQIKRTRKDTNSMKKEWW